MSSSPRAPLKRGRSLSPDPEAKPTVQRPERKKLKLMTSVKPSARKQRLFQLLYRPKTRVAAPLRNASRKAVLKRKAVLNVVPPPSLKLLAPLEACSAVMAAGVQRGCPSPTVSASQDLRRSLETDIPEATGVNDPIPLPSLSSLTKSEIHLSPLGGKLTDIPPSHDGLIVANARDKSKLRNQPWHPYATDNGNKDKPGHGGGTRGALFQVPRKLIRSGEIEPAIQVDKLPTGPATSPSGEMKQAHHDMLEPSRGREPDDASIRQDVVTTHLLIAESTVPSAGMINRNPGQSEMQTIDASFSEPISLFMLTNANETLGSATSSSSDSLRMRSQNSDVFDEIITPSAELPIQRPRSDVSSSSMDGIADQMVVTKSASSGADSDLIPKQPVDTHITPRFFNSSVMWSSPNTSSILLHPDHVEVTSREMLVATTVVPNEEMLGPQAISAELDTSASQLHLIDTILDAPQLSQPEVVLPKVLLDNRNADITALNRPLDNSINSGGIHSASPFLFKDKTPSLLMNSSALVPMVNLPFLPATTLQVKPNKQLGVVMLDGDSTPTPILPPVASNIVAPLVGQNVNANSISIVPSTHNQLTGFQQALEPQQLVAIQPKDIPEPSNVPHQTSIPQLQMVQATAISRPVDVPQAMDESRLVDIPKPVDPLQPHESHLTDIPRTVDIPDVPQYTDMDVDELSAVDVNGSDFDEYTGDLDENQSGDILNSDTYRQLKIQPHDRCPNGTLAKIVEMLAKARPPNRRLPKILKERGQPRQFDVSREDNQLKTCVREFAHHLLGQMPWDVPSEGELLAFENGQGAGPTPMSFRLDLASQGLASKWNAQAAEVFTEAFLNEDELARECSDRGAILSAFIVHLITLQKRYLQPILRAKMTEAELNGERDKQKQKAREQRKRGLFRRRINATKDYEGDPLLKVLYTSFWLYCTPEVMSDDETDSEWDGPADRVAHFIKVMNWRNPDVVNFFRVLDALYFSMRFQWNKWSPGRFPHTRVPSMRRTECDAVPGLPVNFYRPQWLLQLSEIERRKLKIRPAINLEFSQEILRIAARFLHIRYRKQLPLPHDHPALQGITRSTFPSGFPLEDQLHQVLNEALMTRTTNTPQLGIPSTTDTGTAQQTATMTSLSQNAVEPGGVPCFTVPSISVEIPTTNTPFNPMSQPASTTTGSITFTRLPTHNLSHLSESNNILVTPVAAVGSPGDSSRPQIYLVNQPLHGPAGFPPSYMVALEAGSGSTPAFGSRGLPMQPGHSEVPESSNGNWGLSSTNNTNQKWIEPFTLGRHSRRFIKKSGKGKEKAS